MGLGEMLEDAYIVLSGAPTNRLADLRARKVAGRLTSAEMLALAVLAGGAGGEEALGALIDAATEEFGHGAYRVPVRVVGDPESLRLVVSAPGLDQDDADRLSAYLTTRIAQPGPTVVVVPAGVTIDAYEIPAGGPDVVARGGE